MTELKPCPHCRAAPDIHPQHVKPPSVSDDVAVWCSACGALGPKSRTPEEAVAAWNRRALEPWDKDALATLLMRWIDQHHENRQARAIDVAEAIINHSPLPEREPSKGMIVGPTGGTA